MRPIPYAKQLIDADDVQAVTDALQSDWLTQGPAVGQFESQLAAYCDARHGVAVNSGTAALHISALALGLGPGKILWTSPNSFVSSANCGLFCGATIDFIDIDYDTGNIDIQTLEEKLLASEKNGSLPDVIIPVHFAGQSCDMARFGELKARYGFSIIEDACHALGGSYRGTPIGNCAFSDITVFSFHAVKSLTTGEGGMAVTNSDMLCEKLRQFGSHGITRTENHFHAESHGPWYYEQIDLGYNYRMTDIQAALGSSQLRKLDVFISNRQILAERYVKAIQDSRLPLTPLSNDSDSLSAHHLFVVRLNERESSLSRAQLFQKLREKNILTQVHYIPIHTQPYYKERGFDWGDFPNAEKHYLRSLSLPLFVSLSENEQSYVIDALCQLLK